MNFSAILIAAALAPVAFAAANTNSPTGPAVKVSGNDVDQIAWVGNAMFQSSEKNHPEDVVIAEAMVQLFRQDPGADPASVIATCNQIRNQYRTQAATANGSSDDDQTITDVADTVAAIAAALPGGDKISGIIQESGKWYAAAYDNTIGIDNQIASQIDNYSKYPVLDDPASVWSDAWSISQALPRAALAVNAVFQPDFNMDTNQDASAILANNPRFADHAKILGSLGSDGSLQVGINQIQQGLSDVESRLGQIDQNALDQQGSIDDLSIEAQQILANQQAQASQQQQSARAEILREQQQMQIQAEQSSVYILSTMSGFIDPKLARPIATIGNAAITVANAISNLSTETATTAGSAIMTGNVLGAVMSLTSLFGGGPSQEQVLSRQIQQLSQQVSELSTQMNARFDRVDAELNAIMTGLNDDFIQMASMLGETEESVKSVQSSVLEQRAEISQVDRDVYTILTTGLDAQFKEDLETCFDVGSSIARLSYPKYYDCLQRFFTHATQASREGLPDMANIERPAIVTNLTDALSTSSLTADIPLLAQISSSLYQHPLAPPGTSLGNPVEWAMGAEAYMDLMAKYPEFSRLTDLSDKGQISQILGFGTQMDQALKSISSYPSVAGTQPDGSFLHALLQSYRQQIDGVASAIGDVQSRYVRDPANGINIDIWKGPDQSSPSGSWGGPRTISACSGERGDWLSGDTSYQQLSLPVPDAFEEIIPDSVKNAVRLGLVQLKYCILFRPVGQVRVALDTAHPSGAQYSGTVDMELIANEVDPKGTQLGTLFARHAVINFQGTGVENLAANNVIPMNWNGGAAFANALSASGADNTDSYTGVKNTTQTEAKKWKNLVQSAILADRRKVALYTEDNLQGNYHSLMRFLDAYKTLIKDYVQLGLPASWSQDDYLRMLLDGSEQIFDSAALEAYLSNMAPSDATGATQSDQLRAVMHKRVDALENELIRVINKAPGKESLPALSASLRRLGDMKADLSTIVPSRPIADVINEIVQKTASLTN